MPGTQPTLQSLAEQTAALQRRLLELLATYPEEHLSGHEQYLSRIFTIYWRHEEIASNQPYDLSDKRYWDCVMWVRWFEDYIIELEALLALVELTPQRLALLPLRSKVSEPATRVAELLGTQAEVLQRWATEAEEKVRWTP